MWASSDFEDSEYSRFEDWDFTYSVNVKGTVIFAESVAEKMKERNYGKIINIASHAGKYASPSNAAYGASKAAVIHLTQSLALRWASNNINVNVMMNMPPSPSNHGPYAGPHNNNNKYYHNNGSTSSSSS